MESSLAEMSKSILPLTRKQAKKIQDQNCINCVPIIYEARAPIPILDKTQTHIRQHC